ncbi:hypothetical protein BLSTO_05159 [Blastocystis sp. subtype 1]
MAEEEPSWYSLYSVLYDLKASSALVKEMSSDKPISAISKPIVGFLDNVEQCFLFGLLDEGEDTLFQLFQSLSATDDVVAAAIKDSTEANGAKMHECLIGMLCAFLNRHSLSSVVIALSKMENVGQYYGYSFFRDSQCLSLLMPILQFLETIPFSLPIQIPPTEESPSSETAFSLWSTVFGGFISSLESSVDYIDSVFDEALAESALRSASNDDGIRIPDVIAPDSGIEPLLCVPRILTLLLSSLEENWCFDPSMILSYDLNQVLPVIDFFRQNNRLPAGIQTPLGLSILYYILSNLKVSFIPAQHYNACLHTGLTHRSKSTCSKRFCATYPPEEVSSIRHAILHFLLPSAIHVNRPQTEGEAAACEELLALMVTRPAEVLQEARREIEASNAVLSDKKQRVSGIVQLVGVSVDIADTQGMSLRLLKQLWSKTVALYCQAHDQPIPEFSPISPYWKLLGFQRETPLTDFRGGGVLVPNSCWR